MTGRAAIEPDTKDWTWVLQRDCPDCGFSAAGVDPARLGDRLREDATAWQRRLGASDVRERPDAGVWSPLEHACHVRDVHRVFDGRVRLMLAQDDPTFANWDQDATAVEGDYGAQDPAAVAGELVGAARAVAATYDSVGADQWRRRGLRSNGSAFTVATLGAYHLHDVVHHAHDVG